LLNLYSTVFGAKNCNLLFGLIHVC
jgi:hypothetical protein